MIRAVKAVLMLVSITSVVAIMVSAVPSVLVMVQSAVYSAVFQFLLIKVPGVGQKLLKFIRVDGEDHALLTLSFLLARNICQLCVRVRSPKALPKKVYWLIVICNWIVNECGRVLDECELETGVKLSVLNAWVIKGARCNAVISWVECESDSVSSAGLDLRGIEFQFPVLSNRDLMSGFCIRCAPSASANDSRMMGVCFSDSLSVLCSRFRYINDLRKYSIWTACIVLRCRARRNVRSIVLGDGGGGGLPVNGGDGYGNHMDNDHFAIRTINGFETVIVLLAGRAGSHSLLSVFALVILCNHGPSRASRGWGISGYIYVETLNAIA